MGLRRRLNEIQWQADQTMEKARETMDVGQSIGKVVETIVKELEENGLKFTIKIFGQTLPIEFKLESGKE